MTEIMNRCASPFTRMHLQEGWATTCCPQLLTIKHAQPDFNASGFDLWNHAVFNEIRRSVTDGDYKHCQNCIRRKLGRLEHFDGPLPAGPTWLQLADSFVCNLHCPTCRIAAITKEPNAEAKQRQLWRVMRDLAPTLKTLALLGTGEVFSSERHLQFLNEFNWEDNPHIAIEIITNATLVPKRINRISKCLHLIEKWIFSLDACTEETYKKVRLGGSWKDAIEGVSIAKKICDKLEFNFVASNLNAHEAVDFCNWVLDNYNPVKVNIVHCRKTYQRDWSGLIDDKRIADLITPCRDIDERVLVI